jgi:hypothetical protein
MKTRDLISQIRKENGFTGGTKWPKPDDIPRGGMKLGRQLSDEQLLALSEHYVSEFAQVIMKDGTVRLIKGPSSGSVRGGGGKSVEILLPEGAKSKIVRIDHTHPSRDPQSWLSSESDRSLLSRYRNDFNPDIGMRIITRSWDGKIIESTVVP